MAMKPAPVASAIRTEAEAKAQLQRIGWLSQMPEHFRQNLPRVLEDTLHPWAEAGLLPDFPFGTDLTDDELRMVKALKKLKHASQHPAELLGQLLASLRQDKEVPPAWLERLGLADAHSLKDAVLRRLLAGNL